MTNVEGSIVGFLFVGVIKIISYMECMSCLDDS